MKHFGWSRVALLTQSESIFTSVSGKYFLYYNISLLHLYSTKFKAHINNCSLNLIGEYSFTMDNSASSAVNALKECKYIGLLS